MTTRSSRGCASASARPLNRPLVRWRLLQPVELLRNLPEPPRRHERRVIRGVLDLQLYKQIDDPPQL